MSIPKINFNHRKTNNAEFEVIDLAELQQRQSSGALPHNPEQPHRLGFFTLVYIEQGMGRHNIDFAEHVFQPGCCIMVQREQVHAYDFSNNPDGKVLIFTQAFLDQVHANMRLPSYTPTHMDVSYQPVIQLDDNLALSCRNLIDEIVTETGRDGADPLVVMYLFSALSLILLRERPNSLQKRMSREHNLKFSRFFALLEASFSNIRDANWYAEQVHTTYKTLNQVSKLATNLTAKQLIDAYTILEIKRRLVLNTGTTQQLAFELGFEDTSNFVKYFKKHTGLTPSQFQRKYIEPYL